MVFARLRPHWDVIANRVCTGFNLSSRRLYGYSTRKYPRKFTLSA